MFIKKKTRYDQVKKLSIQDMAGFLSWYFDCSRCPAKKENCSDNDAMCMDAITAWLNEEGSL